jgi:hypothetical protein
LLLALADGPPANGLARAAREVHTDPYNSARPGEVLQHDNVAYDDKRRFTVEPDKITIEGLRETLEPIAVSKFKEMLNGRGELKYRNGTTITATFHDNGNFATVTFTARDGYRVEFKFGPDGRMSTSASTPGLPNYKDMIEILNIRDPGKAEGSLPELLGEYNYLIKHLTEHPRQIRDKLPQLTHLSAMLEEFAARTGNIDLYLKWQQLDAALNRAR